MDAEVLHLYELMVRSRFFEELTKVLWEDGLIPGELHLGIGTEAAIAGVVSNLIDGDAIASDHRSTPEFIMRGVNPSSILLEMMGHPGEESLCAGLGGHMHLFSKEYLMATSGIVGASLPGAVGFALAAKYKKTDNIAVSFSGEGSYNQGHALESLNLASTLQLPVLFVCKDNGWSITSKSSDFTGGNLVQRANGFGIDGISLNGLDVEEVYNAIQVIIPRIRKNKKPYFLHVLVTHREGHFTTDPLLNPKDTLKKYGASITKSFLTPKGANLGKRIKSVGTILSSLMEFRKQVKSKNDPLYITRRKHQELAQEFDEVDQNIHREIKKILERTLEIYGGKSK
ncbi:MAG: thiamine pyrophosphate-dependent dehydrogenase E1 component subunit alpha [Candidatus Lokiarchaeota archaeon]|nr:thiamine pyrophosphate-dependent dehydrogenase E1 component subunit alpha [Candidatus Lokiarchaeota archaeon]